MAPTEKRTAQAEARNEQSTFGARRKMAFIGDTSIYMYSQLNISPWSSSIEIYENVHSSSFLSVLEGGKGREAGGVAFAVQSTDGIRYECLLAKEVLVNVSYGRYCKGK